MTGTRECWVGPAQRVGTIQIEIGIAIGIDVNGRVGSARPRLEEMFAVLSAEAQSSERLRTHHNFHTSYADPLQRMLVAIEPGSYVRPHRHLATPKPEALLVLKGRLAPSDFCYVLD